MLVADKDGNTPKNPPLSSLWDGLSPHLLATFYEVDRDNKRPKNTEDITVIAPIIDGQFDVSLNWQSPFESLSIEAKSPLLFALLQSGALQPVIDTAKGFVDDSVIQKTKSGLDSFSGRTGLTKLNSTQVFSGSAGAKIQITVLFRAWRDAITEVEMPFNQFMAWALPEHLADMAEQLKNATDAIKNVGNGNISGAITSGLGALLPSKSPVMIAMKYKNRTFSPLVIEAIGYPITSPIDKNGDYVELSIPLTLATLTAIGRDDWSAYSNNQGGGGK